MSYLADARAAIIAQTQTVTAIRSRFVRLPESITAAPAVVIGQYTWTQTPGNREMTVWNFPLDLYVARSSTDDRTIAAADAIVDELRDALSKGITLSVPDTVQSVVRSGRATDWPNIGGTEFLHVVLELELTQRTTRDYTA